MVNLAIEKNQKLQKYLKQSINGKEIIILSSAESHSDWHNDVDYQSGHTDHHCDITPTESDD